MRRLAFSHNYRLSSGLVDSPVQSLLSVSLVLAGALAAGCAVYPKRARLALSAAAAFALGNVATVVHTLGWQEVLTRDSVRLTTAAVGLVGLAIALGPPALRQRTREGLASLRPQLAEALREIAETSRFGMLGVIAVFALTLYALIAAYLVPSASWDGAGYHEPMVGFALSNHGFGLVLFGDQRYLPAQIDTFPRLVENLALYLVVLTDRRLIDAVNALTYPVALLAAYGVARHAGASRGLAAGVASAIVTVPAMTLQLRSTYIDATFFALTAIPVVFLTAPSLRRRDLWLAGLGMGLLGGAKHLMIFLLPVLGLYGIVRAIAAGRKRRQWSFAAPLVVGIAYIVAMTAPVYVRNWQQWANPLMPSSVHIEALDIDFEGPIDSVEGMRVGAERALGMVFGPPHENQFADSSDNGYGSVLPYVAVVLAPLMLIWIARRVRGGSALRIAAFAVPLLATLYVSPAAHVARYNLHVILAFGALLAAWLANARGAGRYAEPLVAALLIGNLVTFQWSFDAPGWMAPPERVFELAQQGPVTRATLVRAELELMPTHVARMREVEIGDDDLILVAHPFVFVGALFNERMSNRVRLLMDTGPAAFLELAVEHDAEWIVVAPGSVHAVHARRNGWTRVGPVHGGDTSVDAYRRPR